MFPFPGRSPGRCSCPASTLLVYLLGMLTTGVGLLFLGDQAGQVSRFWWGVSLILWGVGALLAGTSYQAFGYQIKCAGRDACSWTSWWEVIYLILQQLSIDAMLIAVAYSCTGGLLQTILVGFAVVSALIYSIVTLIGAIIPLKSLITFEGMVLACSPMFFIVVLLNGWRYAMFAELIDAVLLGIWGGLFLSMAAYWWYDKRTFTEQFWNDGKGIWFSQNDVLHIGLIVWVLYIAVVAAPQISDYVGSIELC
jgi:hypothetical protein